MKEYRSKNKKDNRCCYQNGFSSAQIKSITDNRQGTFVSIHRLIASSGTCQYKGIKLSSFDAVAYISKIGKDKFLAILRHRVTKVGDILLSQINQTTKDCPYIQKWFSYYSQKSTEDIVQAVSKFAPLTQVTFSFNEYIDCLTSRVEVGLQKHIDTGTVEDIPDEIKTGKERPDIFEHIKEHVNPIVQLSKCSTSINAAIPEPTYRMSFIKVKKQEQGKYIPWLPSYISCVKINLDKFEENKLIAWSDGFTGCLMAVFKCAKEIESLQAGSYYVAHVDVTDAVDFKIENDTYSGKGNEMIKQLKEHGFIEELIYFYPYNKKSDRGYQGGQIYYSNGSFSAKKYNEKKPEDLSDDDLHPVELIAYESDEDQQYLLKK